MKYRRECDKEKIPWHSLPSDQVVTELGSDARSGLSEAESCKRFSCYGPNRLTEGKRKPYLKEFIEELTEPLVLLLVATGVLYAVWGEVTDAVTIFCVILALNSVELFNERRAKNAITGLQKLSEPTTPVVREGRAVEIPAEEIVPGDVILLHAGRRVPADARLVDASGLSLDESSLTGESFPVDKDSMVLSAETVPLAERVNFVYAGTLVTRGHARAVVVATGMSTEIGRVASLVRTRKEPRTPLQTAMKELSRWLIWIAAGVSLLVPLLGIILARLPLKTMVLTGLSLAFATVPEELPIIITMVLALGAYRLSKQHAVVKHLKAVETLGAVTVIAADKTGTITENRMKAVDFYPATERKRLLQLCLLCSEAAIDLEVRSDGKQRQDEPPEHTRYLGDPTETALLEAAEADGIIGAKMDASYPLIEEHPFDTVRKHMSVVRRRGAGCWIITKGAPEAVLDISTSLQSDTDQAVKRVSEQERNAVLLEVKRMADMGLRVIAVAEREAAVIPASQREAECDMLFVGLVGLADPPRPEVASAIDECRRAGIRSIMISGDHPLTVSAVGRQVGLAGRVVTGRELDLLSDAQLGDLAADISIYARTAPEHKLRIVDALRARGERVAVTGDGVNDAPALVAADIGLAMGATGSDVAREAGDMVLADDNFATIVSAAREGRVLFENLRKGVRYYLACKVALVLSTLLPVLCRIPVPFTPIQIILMELFMDLAAAATFVAEPPEGDLMELPPRDPRAQFMDRAMVRGILTSAIGLFVAVTSSYLITWQRGAGLATSQTVAFTAWLIGHVLLAANMRSERQPLFTLGLFSNRLIVGWGVAALVFVFAATSVPIVRTALQTTRLDIAEWAMLMALVIAGTFWIEIRKIVCARAGYSRD